MQLSEQIRINAPREIVFAALNDIAILRQAIPGCEEISAITPTEFTATVAAKIGPLKTRFTGSVSLADIVAPESYTLAGEGKGGPAGHVRVSSRVRLTADGQATLLDYDVKADIGGKLAQLGGALVEKTAQKLAQEFFHKFEELVRTIAVEPDTDTDTGIDTDSAGVVTPEPNAEPIRATTPLHTWRWLAAAVAAMVVIGWLAR